MGSSYTVNPVQPAICCSTDCDKDLTGQDDADHAGHFLADPSLQKNTACAHSWPNRQVPVYCAHCSCNTSSLRQRSMTVTVSFWTLFMPYFRLRNPSVTCRAATDTAACGAGYGRLAVEWELVFFSAAHTTSFALANNQHTLPAPSKPAMACLAARCRACAGMLSVSAEFIS